MTALSEQYPPLVEPEPERPLLFRFSDGLQSFEAEMTTLAHSMGSMQLLAAS